MFNVCFSLLVAVLLLRIKLVRGVVQIEYTNAKQYQYCVCVPYWQCEEDLSGLVEDGIDIIDIRKSLARQANDDELMFCTGDFDVCCQVKCGKRSISFDGVHNRQVPREDHLFTRILGENNEAEFAEFPWMLGVIEDRTYRCGASLIHPRVALTAAHCVSGKGPFKIRAGEWNWAERTEPLSHQDRITQKIIIHPQYHPASLRNDIALLILEAPFKLTENIGLVCLSLEDNHDDSKQCVVTGWGKNSYKKMAHQSVLKKMELPLVAKDKCLKSLQQARLGPYFTLDTSFICAGGDESKDACKGDGGSPLVCQIFGQTGRYEQVGIVSWGLACGVFNTPGVYINTGLFIEWIDHTMKLYDFDTNVYKT